MKERFIDKCLKAAKGKSLQIEPYSGDPGSVIYINPPQKTGMSICPECFSILHTGHDYTRCDCGWRGVTQHLPLAEVKRYCEAKVCSENAP